jgi:SNF2 family DNA or RNA helicase
MTQKIHRSQLGLLASQSNLELTLDAGTKALISQLRSFDGITPVELPQGLNATLRPYQLEGYFWLQFLHQHQF